MELLSYGAMELQSGPGRLVSCTGAHPPSFLEEIHIWNAQNSHPHSPCPRPASQLEAVSLCSPASAAPGSGGQGDQLPCSCTETTNFSLFNLQVTGDQCQTLRLNPFGCWLIVGWLLVPRAIPPLVTIQIRLNFKILILSFYQNLILPKSLTKTRKETTTNMIKT